MIEASEMWMRAGLGRWIAGATFIVGLLAACGSAQPSASANPCDAALHRAAGAAPSARVAGLDAGIRACGTVDEWAAAATRAAVDLGGADPLDYVSGRCWRVPSLSSTAICAALAGSFAKAAAAYTALTGQLASRLQSAQTAITAAGSNLVAGRPAMQDLADLEQRFADGVAAITWPAPLRADAAAVAAETARLVKFARAAASARVASSYAGYQAKLEDGLATQAAKVAVLRDELGLPPA